MQNDPSLLNEPSDDALFRYQVLSQVLVREQTGQPRSEAIAAVAAVEHITADRKLRQVSQRSIYRWLAAYESQGFAGLLPAARAHIEIASHRHVAYPPTVMRVSRNHNLVTQHIPHNGGSQYGSVGQTCGQPMQPADTTRYKTVHCVDVRVGVMHQMVL